MIKAHDFDDPTIQEKVQEIDDALDNSKHNGCLFCQKSQQWCICTQKTFEDHVKGILCDDCGVKGNEQV